jgi:plasmid stabilization system protein ParE
MPSRAWRGRRVWVTTVKDLAGSRRRFWTVYSYVIAYRREPTPIRIIAIVHGARQLEAFFRRRIQ